MTDHERQEPPSPVPIVPVPADVPPCGFDTQKYKGVSPTVYSYYSVSNPDTNLPQLAGFVTRREGVNPATGTQEKRIVPWSFCVLPDGSQRWHPKAIPEPRPLYGLPQLLQNPELPVLVCEGEKTAEAAQKLFPHCLCITSMGGANAAHKTDWSPVRNKRVIITPDCDEAGKRYADTVYDLCLQQGAQEILYLATEALTQVTFSEGGDLTRRETEIPKGYDLADALEEGWTAPHLTKHFGENLEGLIRPYIKTLTREERLQELNKSIHPLFVLKPDGVYYRKTKKSKDEEEDKVIELKLCSYLAATHQIRSPDGTHDWGRLFELKDNDGTMVSHIILMEELGGDGNAYRSALLSWGLQPAIHWSQKLLHLFIATSQPVARARIVKKPGWHNHCFVLPHETYGATAEEKYILYPESEPFSIKGNLKDWREHIGKLCEGNAHLILSVSLPLVGPLLHLLGEENFCIHFVSSSSTGKSTALEVASSVFGQRMGSWRTTDNAAESMAKKANDTLLILDKISQGDSKSVDAMAYMLGNGMTKGRANRLGEARPVESFRTVILSSGETGLSMKLQEAGKKGKAGQTVRLIEIDSDAGKGLGIFESLHGFENGNLLSQELKRRSKLYQGTVGDAYLRGLYAQDLEELKARIEKARKRWVDTFVPPLSDGQVQRVGNKFALIAAAGELAIAFGVFLYPRECVEHALADLYKKWIESRGGLQSYELRQVEERLKSLIVQQGGSRFETPWELTSSPLTVHNRAGFKKRNERGEWEYYLFPNVFKDEVVGTLAERRAKEHLASCGFLVRDRGGYTTSLHVPGYGQVRLYKIASKIITDEETIEGGEAYHVHG